MIPQWPCCPHPWHVSCLKLKIWYLEWVLIENLSFGFTSHLLLLLLLYMICS